MSTYIVTLKIKMGAESKMDVWEEIDEIRKKEKLNAVEDIEDLEIEE